MGSEGKMGGGYDRKVADERHSGAEDRFIVVGYSAAHHILVVSYSDRRMTSSPETSGA
jgi:uncharacterized DUF497 family protein